MKKTMILIVTLLTVAFMASNAFSWGYGKGKGGCRGYGNQSGAWQDLTQEQKDELKALHQAFIDDTYETRAAMSQKREEIRMLMETSQPDRDKLVLLTNEMMELKKEVRLKRIDFHLEAKKIAPDLKGFGMGPKGKCGGKGKGGCPGKASGGCPGLQNQAAAESL